MKLKSAALLCFLVIVISNYGEAKEKAPSPQADIEQTTYTFSPVIAGTDVTHRFNIANKGNAPLNIPGVYVK